MNIRLEENVNGGTACICEQNQTLAEMTWLKGGEDYIIIDHTMVSETLKGRGIGRKLLDRIVEYARENNLRILPLCPFVNAVFIKSEEIRDVLYH